jgi:hypothetical protein
LTLGYWSNKNGQKVVTASDLTFLSGLFLRNANGSDFDPTTAAKLSTWLLSANATNMAFMLSAQLATMELNVRHPGVSGGALVFAGTPPAGCSVTVDNGFITVNNLMTAANALLGTNPVTVAASPARSCEEFVKNALDGANNNKNFSVVCPVDSSVTCATN